MKDFIEPIHQTYVKDYGFYAFAKNMGKNIDKNISKNLICKYIKTFLVKIQWQMFVKLLQKDQLTKL